MMLSSNGSPRKNAISAPSPASIRASRGSSEIGVAIFTAPPGIGARSVRPMLLPKPDLLRTDMPEEPRGPNEQHDDEDTEPGRVLQGRIDVEPRDRLRETDHEAAD